MRRRGTFARSETDLGLNHYILDLALKNPFSAMNEVPRCCKTNPAIHWKPFIKLQFVQEENDLIYVYAESHSLVAVKVYPAVKFNFELKFILGDQDEPQEEIANELSI